MSVDKQIGLVLLFFGVLGILLSVFYESSVLAIVGLTLTFWGCIFLLVLPGKYVKSEDMDHICGSSLSAVDQVIADANLQGKAIYVPVPRESYPPYTRVKNEFVYIPERDVNTEIAIEHAFVRKPKGLRLYPPGLDFADFMEKKSMLSFRDLNLNSFTEVLPSIITHDLEIAVDFRISLEGNELHTEIRKPVCEGLCKEARKLRYLCPHVGCPLCSSIACVLTRVTNRPVIIEKCSLVNGNIETDFRIIKD